jgi:hypothetical protein
MHIIWCFTPLWTTSIFYAAEAVAITGSSLNHNGIRLFQYMTLNVSEPVRINICLCIRVCLCPKLKLCFVSSFVNFTNILRAVFSYQSVNGSFSYRLCFHFFGKRKLSKKLLLKCWWKYFNWSVKFIVAYATKGPFK